MVRFGVLDDRAKNNMMTRFELSDVMAKLKTSFLIIILKKILSLR
jgi:hypothetical protein